MTLRCAPGLVDETLVNLRAAGQRGTEGVVLWLAKRPLIDVVTIVEAYVPEHSAEVDVFRIPPSGMAAMMAHLRARKLALAAQVHSHPGPAFHSCADDAWAIVRHEGALSMVVPDFAAGVTAGNFLDKAATFRLSPTDQWLVVRQHELVHYLAISA
jgi:proteasome lid subunit RPN8/RPN11